jgi:hypothetical protein
VTPPPLPLLLTATVSPPSGVPFLTRSDPRVRLADYAEALRTYLQLPDDVVDRIVVADNSNTELLALERVVAASPSMKEVELLSFPGREYPVEQGRSVGETYLIDDALAGSRILSELDDDDLFWKVTGRLRVRNFARLAASTPDCDLYIDLRRYRIPWADTRVFAATSRGFRAAFLSRVEILRHDLLPEGVIAPEQLLFDELLELGRTIRLEPRLRVEPVIEGSSGLGEDYRRPRRRLESGVRAVTRRLVPSLWI